MLNNSMGGFFNPSFFNWFRQEINTLTGQDTIQNASVNNNSNTNSALLGDPDSATNAMNMISTILEVLMQVRGNGWAGGDCYEPCNPYGAPDCCPPEYEPEPECPPECPPEPECPPRYRRGGCHPNPPPPPYPPPGGGCDPYPGPNPPPYPPTYPPGPNPPYPPGPPKPPPPVRPENCQASGYLRSDPHGWESDGGRFDLQGRPGGVYNVLSDAGIVMNTMLAEWRPDIGARDGKNRTVISDIGLVLGGDRLSMSRDRGVPPNINNQPMTKNTPVRLADGSTVVWDGVKMTVKTKEYTVTVESSADTPMRPDREQSRSDFRYLNVKVETNRATGYCSDGILPDGVLGHTFDRDFVPTTQVNPAEFEVRSGNLFDPIPGFPRPRSA